MTEEIDNGIEEAVVEAEKGIRERWKEIEPTMTMLYHMFILSFSFFMVGMLEFRDRIKLMFGRKKSIRLQKRMERSEK